MAIVSVSLRVGAPPASGSGFLRLSIRFLAFALFLLADNFYAGAHISFHFCVRC